jgi:cell division protein FtsZ
MTEKTLQGLGFIVNDALKYTEMEREYIGNQDSIDRAKNDEHDWPVIKVIGVGGAGNNTINRLYNIRLDEAEIIGINTDKQHLDVILADKKVLIGKSLTRGLGAGGFPEIGKRTAEGARNTFREILRGADIVLITAGIGGGTGTGAAPVVAEVAREQGAIVVSLVSIPFGIERAHGTRADKGLADLRAASNAVIALDSDILLKYVPNLPLEQAFSVMDQLIAETVKGITLSLSGNSLVGIGMVDLMTVLSEGGNAVLIVGESKNQDMYEDVVKIASCHPLNILDFRHATGALVHVTGGPEMRTEDAEKVVKSLVRELSPNIKVAWSACIEKDYEGRVRAIAIMTGIKESLPSYDRR